ncbi:MAG: glycosyltransferase family 39 protein [Candidatus Schekmanbacteria bacterium]|nr:glycosyltransferase family 39 protein [Candidatus Schekmanbacteria bacterium]
MQYESRADRFIIFRWVLILLTVNVCFFIFSELVLHYPYQDPLNVRFRPSAHPLYVTLCVLTFLSVLLRWRRDWFLSLSEKQFVFLTLFLAFFFDVSLASTDQGFMYAIPHSFISTTNEYYWDIGKINGLRNFLRDYVKMMPDLSLHANTHPPGADVFFYLIHRFLGEGAMKPSIIALIVSNLSLIPLYLTLKMFLSERALRFAIILWIFTPAIGIYSAVCMDGVFMFFLLWPFYFFFRYLVTGKNLLSLSFLTGASLAAAGFMTFSVAYECLFFTLLTGFCIYRKHERWKGMCLSLCVAGAVFVLFYYFFYQATGYNIRDCLDAARDKDMVNYGSPFYSFTKYIHSRIANFSVYSIFMGFASFGVFIVYLRGWYRRFGLGNKLMRSITYVAILTMLEMVFGGLYFFETGRIWIYLSPIFLGPVAETITLISDTAPGRIFETDVLTLTFLQTMAIEIIFYTFW